MIRCEIRRCGNAGAFIPVLRVPGKQVENEGRGYLFGATAVCAAHMGAARQADYVTDEVYEALGVMAEKMGIELAAKADIKLEWRSIWSTDSETTRQRRKIAARQGLLS